MKKLMSLAVVGAVLAMTAMVSAAPPPAPAPEGVAAKPAPVVKAGGPLYECVEYKDLDEMAPCAVPKIVEVVEPRCPCCKPVDCGCAKPAAPKCCAPAPKCSAPAPKCCAPAPKCSAPAPKCCAPAPECSAPAPKCCAPAPKCSAPAPKCCAPVAPTCGKPVKRECCCPPPKCVKIMICVPPCGCETVKVSKDGRKVTYDYGKYSIDIRVKKDHIEVDYQD